VPENDEMVLNNAGAFDQQKDDLYRSEIGEAPISGANNVTSSPENYCVDMTNEAPSFIKDNETLLATGQSPVTSVGTNLFTFLANRLSMSFTNLDCSDFGLANPVTLTLNGAGVATAATFNTAQQKATSTGTGGTGAGNGSTTPAPTPPGGRKGRPHHQEMDPSGM
jgi:hypothetical protein